ncbi:MAG: chemotaxis protein CheA [Thermodesulfobacteriota bacterium]
MDVSKYKKLYLEETAGHISGVEKGLLALENDPADPDTIDNLFRHYHSLKGMSASMGYEPIKKLAHAQEDLLSQIRSKKAAATPAMISTLFDSLDRFKELLSRVEEDRPLDIDITGDLKNIKSIEADETGEPAESSQPQKGAENKKPSAMELKLPNTLKVDSSLFDELLATVGELFMAIGSLKELSLAMRNVEFKDGLYGLGKTLDKLHAEILNARMLPIRDLTEGLPRIIRDMSRMSGKSVELKITGTGISIDRTILEDLGSPLVHIIRNCVDHGIETPKEREDAGKASTGNIVITAHEKRKRVVIEISDDGRGIDVAKVKARALKEGVYDASNTTSMGNILDLICLPGLSTSGEVTDTSGRGVGMNVVKDVVEGHGGSLHIESTPGKGTAITIELPRTTSIMKSLIVETGGEHFLVPISIIEKVITLEGDAPSSEALDYEGSRVPLADLGDVLGIKAKKKTASGAVLLIESGGAKKGSGDGPQKKSFRGIRVDGFGMEIDAYIKALSPPLSKMWGISGVTIMGDGRPVFVIDIAQILSREAAVT